MKQGILIAFEGMEGCGKTTQAKLLHEKLTQKGIGAVLTKEPGGIESNKKIREILLERNDLDVFSEVFLFLADRTEHFRKEISPALRQEKIVITDRCSASNIAYQFYGKLTETDGGYYSYPLNLYEFITNADFIARGGRQIDINVLFDGPAKISLERVNKSRNFLTSFEQRPLVFHEKVRQGFLTQSKQNPEKWAIFDFTKPIHELHQEIWNFLNKKFNLTK